MPTNSTSRRLCHFLALLKRIAVCVLAGVALLIASPSTSYGQNSDSARDPQRVWDFGVWAGEAFGVGIEASDPNARLTMAGFQVSRVINRAADGHARLEYVFEAMPLFLVTRPQTVYGGGLSPLGLKWDFARRGQWEPYVEWNGGGVFTTESVPPGRTQTFNFTTSLGPGVMIHARQNQAISLGVRFWHLSNAGLAYDNPSFNTIEVVLGYHWFKSRSVSTGGR